MKSIRKDNSLIVRMHCGEGQSMMWVMLMTSKSSWYEKLSMDWVITGNGKCDKKFKGS